MDRFTPLNYQRDLDTEITIIVISCLASKLRKSSFWGQIRNNDNRYFDVDWDHVETIWELRNVGSRSKFKNEQRIQGPKPVFLAMLQYLMLQDLMFITSYNSND